MNGHGDFIDPFPAVKKFRPESDDRIGTLLQILMPYIEIEDGDVIALGELLPSVKPGSFTVSQHPRSDPGFTCKTAASPFVFLTLHRDLGRMILWSKPFIPEIVTYLASRKSAPLVCLHLPANPRSKVKT